MYEWLNPEGGRVRRANLEAALEVPEARLRGGLIALLAVSLLLSVLFALGVPLNGNPDETSHRDYIRLLIENRGFVQFVPVPFDTDFAGRPTPWETHQPPLYYLLCLPVHLASGGSVFAVRMVAALLQLATIAAAFFACRDLFPKRPWLALGTASFVAFLPSQTQLSASISNDSLTTLLCAALFWRLGLLVTRGQTVAEALAVGLLFGLGLWTKLSVLQLLPAFGVAYLLAARAKLLSPREAVGRMAIAVGFGLVLASPWLLRNLTLYGDPLALSIYKLTGPNFTPQDMMTATGWSWADYTRTVVVRSYATFWYLLPPQALVPRGPWIAPFLASLVLGLGGALGIYRGLKSDETTVAEERRVVVLFALGLALLLPFYARFVFTVFQAQGRYFLPALLPAATLCALGWSNLTGRTSRGALLPGIVLLVLALYQLLTYR